MKGRVTQDNPALGGADEYLLAGIALHRKIDAISNHQTSMKDSYQTLPTHLRRIAPILIDLLADHSLARHWSDHYQPDVHQFAHECYSAIGHYQGCLTAPAQRFYEYMKEVDLLANYHQWAHIERGIRSVLRRLSNSPDWSQVEQAAKLAVPSNDRQFAHYYPQLRTSIVELQS